MLTLGLTDGSGDMQNGIMMTQQLGNRTEEGSCTITTIY